MAVEEIVADGPSATGQAGSAPIEEVGSAAPGPADVPGDALTEGQLEALLFVAERPLSRRELSRLTGASVDTVDARLGDLEVGLRERGLRLVLLGEQVALATAPEAGPLIARFLGGVPARFSPALLETLAIVAYRQPITRAEIERLRGVDSEHVLRVLVHRRLVVEAGRAETPGRPHRYVTGFGFLELFGLTSLEELPPIEDGLPPEPPDPLESRAGSSSAAPRDGGPESPG